MEELRVLIVDDNEDDAWLLRDQLLEGGWTVSHRRVDRRQTMIEALQQQTWDAVICDYQLPDFTPQEALTLLHSEGLDLPFIVVSGVMSEEAAVAVMKAGAHDFCTKGNLHRLAPAVERELKEARERVKRRQAEAALLESEDRFRILADSAPVLIWMMDRNGDAVFFNRTWRQFTGRIEQADRGRGWIGIMHPGDRPRASEKWFQAVASAEEVRMEYRLRRSDGAFRWMLATGVPRRSSDGSIAGYLGSCVDITERKEAEQVLMQSRDELERKVAERTTELTKAYARLSDSEERFRTLVSSMEDLVITMDRTAKVTGVFGGHGNPGLPKDLLGHPLDEVVGEELYKALFAPRLHAALEGKSQVFEAPARDPGTFALYSFFPLRDRAGKVSGIVSVSKDISELKRLQRQVLEVSEWERQRLGQEFHEGLSQHLAGIAFLSKTLEAVLHAKSPGEAQHMNEISRLIHEAMAQGRNLAKGLFPVELEAHGLGVALQELCERLAQPMRFECELFLEDSLPELDKETAYHLYRIAQDALLDSVHRGEASKARLDVRHSKNSLTLLVTDDGKRPLPGERDPEALGIRIMAYRASMIGGRLSVEPAEPRGSLLRFTLETSH